MGEWLESERERGNCVRHSIIVTVMAMKVERSPKGHRTYSLHNCLLNR